MAWPTRSFPTSIIPKAAVARDTDTEYIDAMKPFFGDSMLDHVCRQWTIPSAGRIRLRVWITAISTSLMACLAGLPSIHAADQDPEAVVAQWLTLYPKHLERAVDLTTETFRQGLSKEAWLALRGPHLQNLRLRYVRAKIAGHEIDGQEARVIVNTHVVTAQGDHPQDEVYFLKKGPDGIWLIDQIEVYLENFNRLP